MQTLRYTSGPRTREFNHYTVIENPTVTRKRGSLRHRRNRKHSRAALVASVNSTKVAESQRMTHIAVERNRRRLMNDHLAALRSLMLPPFVQRGDQASIIGGVIDFVKELEQVLLLLLAEKRQCKSTVAGTPSAASTYARPSRDPAARRTSAPRWRQPSPV